MDAAQDNELDAQVAAPAASTRTSAPAAPARQANPDHVALLRLQGTAGNQAVAALMREPHDAEGTEKVDVLSLTDAEYQALTGESADLLPEGTLPGLDEEVLSPAVSAVPTAIGTGSLFTPRTNWIYRVLVATDPTARTLLDGTDLAPRTPVSVPLDQAEMTFRQTRAGGDALHTGTDRVSLTPSLEMVAGPLKDRGTEVMRIDMDAARRLGARFLENGEILADLDEVGAGITNALEQARATTRGKVYVGRLESRLDALNTAVGRVRMFQELHGVGAIPSRSMTQVKGGSPPEAAARELALLENVRIFRHAGRVLIVVGIGASIARVESAPQGQRGRVAAQETGGWALSLSGGASGARLGAMIGAGMGFESGPGALIAAIVGSLILGTVGFVLGEAAADKLYDAVDPSTWLEEALQSDYNHFKELNPEATPADFNRLQDAEESFNAGIFQ